MSNFPNSLDTDVTLPPVNDNITEEGADAINALRDAVFAVEQNIGIGAAGTMGTIAARLDVFSNPNGTVRTSAIASLGLVTLPITQDQIANFAQIPESKLKLDFRTQDLFNYITDLSQDVNTSIGWIASTGIKLEPHLLGAIYKHDLTQIDVNQDPAKFLFNKFRLLRDNTHAYSLINDINNELLAHQWADGSLFSGTISDITTNNGSTYPSNYAHTASGIFLDTSRFATIPQTADDVQQLADFIDSASIFLLGTRIQNLYSNGISRESRSSSLTLDGYGSPLVPSTLAIAFLKNTNNSSSPFDDINAGDDIIEFKPSTSDMNNNSFDSKFALVKVGDIIRINYGTVEIAHIVKEKKYIQNGGLKKYVIRIVGKNLMYTPNAMARIDRPLFNIDKYGVLAVAPANSGVSSIQPSLIVATSRGAQTLGVGFNPDQLDNTHYLLYLALYPTGNPADGYLILPPIDITGNQGTTPGLYTLESVLQATNDAFRKPGYNYRFIAYQYKGEFGICLADSYFNTGFSVLSGVVDGNGFYDKTATEVTFANNVVGLFGVSGATPQDPLGMGPMGANVASPPFQTSYTTAPASNIPTKLFLPHKRNNYYVNGIEREKMTLDIEQLLDVYGDGYWEGTIISQNIIPAPAPAGRVETTYRIALDLSASQLKIGKTLVVQNLDGYGIFPNDFGRYIIKDITFGCAPSGFTDITVYDAVHGTATSPAAAIGVGAEVALYFNSDSVSFNQETATDFTGVAPFKRHFEVYIDESGYTFTHERGRVYNGNSSPIAIDGNVPLYNYTELTKMDIIKISPKLRGYTYGAVNKITLNVNHFNATVGTFDGYLSAWDGDITHPVSHLGPVTFGKLGETVRFYDETNIDFIDVYFDNNLSYSSFNAQKIDFQLFPTLSLDHQVMMISACQFNDTANFVNHVLDERQFGNTSEKDLSTSALRLLSQPERLLHGNGIIRGFDLELDGYSVNPNLGQLFLQGGEALIDGNFFQLNNETVNIPIVMESPNLKINWIVCINSKGEYQPIPLLDHDEILNTPVNPVRIFKVMNPLTGLTYNVDATTFSDIINNRKDLVPLYLVASTITLPAVIGINVTDVRKYVFDIDTNQPLKLTSANAQGNFKSVNSMFTWLKYNNAFNSYANFKGADNTSGIVSIPLNLDFNHMVTLDGQSDATLTFTQPVIIGSNIMFKNMNLIFNGGVSAATAWVNTSFENCNVTINVNNTPTNNVVFDVSRSNHIRFDETHIVLNYNVPIPLPTSLNDINTYGGLFRFSNSSDLIFENGGITATFISNPGVNAPGDIFMLTNFHNFILENFQIDGYYNQALHMDGCDYVRVQHGSIKSNYSPLIGSPGTPDFGYQTNDLVNTGNGYIYGLVSSQSTDILIDDVTFMFNPFASGNNNRFSFVNFELTTRNSTLSNLTVSNCKMNSNSFSTTSDDYRAGIAIINTYNDGTNIDNPQPMLINAKIISNIANRNQAIIISSLFSKTFDISYPGLATIGCVVRDNIVGTIGYIVTTAPKTSNISPNINVNSDKSGSLLIHNNICHYIANMEGTGRYLPVSTIFGGLSVNRITYPTGYVEISNNKTSWIHVGNAFEENASMTVRNNTCSAYDSAYLPIFLDTSPNIYGNSDEYAIFVGSNRHISVNTQTPGNSNNGTVLIEGNTVETGYWYSSAGFKTQYNYSGGYIFSQGSSIITNNTLRGIGRTGGMLICVGGVNNVVTQNRIYRGDNNNLIQAFVGFLAFDVPVWDGEAFGANTTGIITDNFFDNPYIFNTNENTIAVPAAAGLGAWIYERNKNQTVNSRVPYSAGVYGLRTDTANGPTVLGKIPGITNSSVSIAFSTDNIDFNYADTTSHQYMSWEVAAGAFLPPNCSIISATMQGKVDVTTGFTKNINLFFIDVPNGDSIGSSLVLTNSFATVTQNTPGYTTFPDSQFRIVMELEIVHSSSAVKASAQNMIIKYRW